MKISFLRLSRFCFYLFFAFLPFQIDVVFSVTDLYPSGFFNPFSTYFFNVTEFLLIASFLFLTLHRFFSINSKFVIKVDSVGRLYLLLLFSVLISCFFATDINVSLLYLWRFIEGFFVYILLLSGVFDFKKIMKIFVFVMIFEAVLGILQFAFQHSLGLSLLGEPFLDLQIKGVASTTVFGEKLLRAYGTFSHPNVFAMFLVFAIFFCLFLKMRARILISSILSFALVFTFSRTGFLAAGLGIMGFLFLKKDSKYLRISVLFLILLGALLILRFMFDADSALVERWRLFLIAMDMFFHNPFGVGVENFTLVMSEYSDLKLLPWNYQPVHNIFILAFAELGILGGVVLISMLMKRSTLMLPLWLIFIVGASFDHYFLTLYQGQMLFVFFLALSSYYSKNLA